MATEETQDVGDEAEEAVGNGGNGGGKLLSTLTNKEVLVPAVLSAAGAVAAAKGPDLVRSLTQSTAEKGREEAEKIGESAVGGAKKGIGESLGNAGGVAGKVLSRAVGGGGGGGGKKTRRLPIERWTDVAVPLEDAYEAWTTFDKYPTYMHRVLSVEQKGRDRVSWQEKIWFSKRQWEGRITDRRKNDRIAWKTTSGMSHKGVVSFHKLDDRLTRVMVTMEFEPSGMIEKMASGLRFVKRAVQADLARFKAYVELDDAKGIDYRPNEQKDEQKDDKKGEAKSRNGSGRNEKNDDARESERQERDRARQERRERAASK